VLNALPVLKDVATELVGAGRSAATPVEWCSAAR